MKVLLHTFLLACFMLVAGSLQAQPRTSPVGYWKTIDDKTGKPKAVVEIYEENGKLYGRIVELIREPGEDLDPICEKCPGDKKGKPIRGMVILWDLKKKGDHEWGGGKIMDPKNGKVYSAKIELAEDGTLRVRGYLGFSLLGRTQVWHPLTPEQVEEIKAQMAHLREQQQKTKQ